MITLEKLREDYNTQYVIESETIKNKNEYDDDALRIIRRTAAIAGKDPLDILFVDICQKLARIEAGYQVEDSIKDIRIYLFYYQEFYNGNEDRRIRNVKAVMGEHI